MMTDVAEELDVAVATGRVITTSLSAVAFSVENEIQAHAETIITAARLGEGRIKGGGRVMGKKEGRHMRSRRGNRLVKSCMQMVAAEGVERAGACSRQVTGHFYQG